MKNKWVGWKNEHAQLEDLELKITLYLDTRCMVQYDNLEANELLITSFCILYVKIARKGYLS
ncbi:hypothetical protein L915_08842, partial [Phytophthora nicotianae]